MRLLDAAQVADMVTMDEAVGGTFTRHCAALDPARLVRGLADAVAARGVEIHEQTRVTAIERGRVSTPHGTVRAEVVAQATEGYTRTCRACGCQKDGARHATVLILADDAADAITSFDLAQLGSSATAHC